MNDKKKQKNNPQSAPFLLFSWPRNYPIAHVPYDQCDRCNQCRAPSCLSTRDTPL